MSDWALRELPRPYAFIQWKGTDVCADYYCVCGEQFHLDADFVYAVECPYCDRVFEVTSKIELRELGPGEKWDGCGPVRGDKEVRSDID